MYSIFKKEVAAYFNSLLGYLAIGLFLLLSGLLLWVFPDSSILDAGYASLDNFFSFAPYLFMFLAPAISMRALAGEKADGTFELLLSRPLTLAQIILGKYLGGLLIILLSLLPTSIYVYSIYELSFPKHQIDMGAIIGSYIGLFLLASSFIAMGIFTSAISKNPIISFLTGAFLSFVAYYGFDAISQLSLFENLQDGIQNLGIQSHYLSLSRGVLLLPDVLYFLSLIILFISLSVIVLEHKRSLKSIFITCIAVFLCSILGNFIHAARIDFTSDQRFTLQPQSIEILQNLKQDIYINIFLDGDIPPGFKRLKTAAVDMALDFKRYSSGRVKFSVIDPMAGSSAEQQQFSEALISRGLYPTHLSVKTQAGLSQKLIYPAAVISTDSTEINVNLLQNRMGANPEQILNNSVQNIEYAFISAISKLESSHTPLIGFTEGHNEPTDLELYDAMHSLAVGNQVGRVHLDSISIQDLNKFSILIIAKPKIAFSEADKYKIDYFVRHGGRLIWALDQVDVELDDLRKSGEQVALGRSLNLDDLLFQYGVRFNYNLIADMNCGQIPVAVGQVGGQSQIELTPWLFHPILMPNNTHPALKNLDGIYTKFVGTIDTIATENLKKEIVLSSSPFSKILNTGATISLKMIEQQPNPKEFQGQTLPVAAFISGKFPYIFDNRAAPAGITEPYNLSQIQHESRMFMIADGDWITNQINAKDQSPFPMGWDRYMEQQFANKSLLLNVVDYLLNDESLIALRNREVKLRLLDDALVKSQKLTWQLINIIGPLALLLSIAMLQQYIRRRQYTS